MSNHSINPFGGGRRPTLRSLKIGLGDRSLAWMLGLVVLASSAWISQAAVAAEIVEVRIGKHAEFTRVVFELDRAVGYRIERADPISETEVLVISLEASSIPRRIKSSKSLIVMVEVEPFGARSVARIRLAKDGLRLKEMILSNPPRIVIDVFRDAKIAPVVAKATQPKAQPVLEPKEEAVPSLDEPTFDEIVAQLPPDPEPAQETAPTPTPVVESEPIVAAPTELEEIASDLAIADEPSTSIPMEEPELIEPEILAAAEPVEPEPSRSPRPMVVKSKPVSDQGSDWMTWAFMGLGGITLVLGGVLMARRVRGGKEVDFAGDETDVGDGITMAPQTDENPFGNVSGDGSQMTLGTQDTTTASLADDEKQSESVVFDDSEEKTMEDMEVISREQVNESLGGMPSAIGGIPEEFQQMVREMNRRVESLEGRIDELVDARDRLERQVAAQTEELRVQRAAIARTQRAVRNLARPGEGEGGQEPTEPALRDPSSTS